MIEEQEAVRGSLFMIQDVMQSTVRTWLRVLWLALTWIMHDKSLTVTHNLRVFAGDGLVLSIITGLFGLNVDGIPGAEESPYAFALFKGILVPLRVLLIGIGLALSWIEETHCRRRCWSEKARVQEVVQMFQQEAQSHAQVRKTVPPTNPTAARRLPDGADYFLISRLNTHV